MFYKKNINKLKFLGFNMYKVSFVKHCNLNWKNQIIKRNCQGLDIKFIKSLKKDVEKLKEEIEILKKKL